MTDRPGHPHRPPESVLLSAIEGASLDDADRAALDAACAADPALAEFIDGARRDRDRLRALARLEADHAPAGLARAALARAEREAIVVGGGAPAVGPRRLQITPVRFVAAAAVLIVVASGSIVGLIFTGPVSNSPPGGGSVAAPDESSAQLDADPGAIADPPPSAAFADAREAVAELARARGESASGPAAPITMKPDPDPGVADALAEPSAGTGLVVRMIRSVKAGPERAVSPERAAALALQGRLMIVVRTPMDPGRVESALLSPADTKTGEGLVVWRSIADLASGGGGGGVAEPLPPGAPRLVLADVLASPAVLSGVVASLRSVGGEGAGAWLQELDRPIRLTPRAVESDARWWHRPGRAWAPRATAPVLIEPAPPAEP